MANVYLNFGTGSDAYSYAQAQNIATPWKSPTKVNASATTGDTANLAAGTYSGTGINTGYTLTKDLTFLGTPVTYTTGAVPVWGTIWDAANAQYGLGFQGSTPHTLVVKYIDFRNYYLAAAGSAYTFGINGGAGSVAMTLTVQECRFKDWRTGANFGQGAVIGGDLSSNPQYWTITKNLFNNIYDSGTASTDAAIFSFRQMHASTVVSCTYNTFYLPATSNILEGIFAAVGGTGGVLTFTGNIIYAATSTPWRVGAGNFATTTANYNVFYQVSSAPSGTGNITSDPLFVDAPNGNFNLRPNSPAIDLVALA